MEAALEFCLKHSWGFNCKMVNIFVTKPWENAPDVWFGTMMASNCLMATVDGLRKLVSCQPDDDWPEAIKDFCKSFAEVSLCVEETWTESFPLNSTLKKGMNVKKQHEISRMATLIQSESQKHKCNVVGDIGCGLGYLGEALATQYNLNVVGFESKDSNCQSVRKPQLDSAEQTCTLNTKLLTVDTSQQCSNVLSDAFSQVHRPLKEPSSQPVDCRVCLVGLHCCGDLSPAMLYQFHTIEHCKALVCMSCCYHRMSSERDTFKHFPLSHRLKNVYGELTSKYDANINGLALRLACQQTKSRWLQKSEEEMEDHVKHVAYRGVIEHYCHSSGHVMSKRYRRLVGLSKFDTFNDYIDVLLERVDTVDGVDVDTVRQGLLSSYAQCQPYFQYIRAYNAVQVVLQGVLESLLLMDRQTFLIEKGYSCKLVSVFDDVLSPRSIALVAHK